MGLIRKLDRWAARLIGMSRWGRTGKSNVSGNVNQIHDSDLENSALVHEQIRDDIKVSPPSDYMVSQTGQVIRRPMRISPAPRRRETKETGTEGEDF